LCNRSTSRSTLHGIDANIEQEAGTSAEAFRARSAIFHVEWMKAPMLLLQGAQSGGRRCNDPGGARRIADAMC
jgi:hypothetical protein